MSTATHPNKAAETQILLEKIRQAIEAAKGDEKKEMQNLEAIIDPADETACDGCQ